VRFVIYGAGAIGGTIAARLGGDVTVIARGAHAAAIRERGLRVVSPDGESVARVAVVEHPRDIAWRGDEVVVLAMKSQDAEAALVALAAAAPPAITVVCAQNGVANERAALRRFADVVAMCVMMPAQHAEPGVVTAWSAPITGLLDVGRYPSSARGVDAGVESIAAALGVAGFESIARPDIMRWKYKKLLLNLGNAAQAACGTGPDVARERVIALARDEANRVLAAAGIAVASDDEDRARRGDKLQQRPIAGNTRGGGSSWQSLARGSGSIETDYLNGEIVLLGRLHGIATPANALLQRTANALARERRAPGSISASELLAELQ
jgi:2-dehydropantoate 2-reductase